MADSDDKIEVKIGAQADEMQQGVAQASDALQAGVNQMIELLQQLVTQSAESSAKIVEDEEKIAHAIEESSEESETALRRMTESIKEQTAEAHEQLEGFVNTINSVQRAFRLLGEVAMLGFVGEQILDLGKEFAEFAEQTSQAAQKTGLTTEKIQELSFAGQQNAVSTEQMQTSLIHLARSMAEAQAGSEQAENAFKSLGISADEIKGASLDEVLDKVANAFQTHADGAAKAALAQQLFGRAGTALIPTLNQGAEGLAKYAEQAKQLGVIMGQDDIEAGEKLNEQFDVLDSQMAALKLRAGSELAPAMTQIANAMLSVSSKGGPLDDMFSALGSVMKFVTAVAMGVGTAFQQMSELIATAVVAINAVVHGEFDLAVNEVKQGFTNMESQGNSYLSFLDKLYAKQDEAPSHAKEGEGGAKPQLQIQPGKDKNAADPVEIWRQQLEQQREASGDYFKQDLAGEEDFWTQKLALTAAGSKQQAAVLHELYQVRSQEAHAQLADDLAQDKAAYDADAQGSLDRVNIATQMAQRIGAAYGEESAQYKAALNEERKAAEEWHAEQQRLLSDQVQQSAQAAATQAAQDSEAAKNRYKLGQETSAQETAELIAAEGQRYSAEMNALEQQLGIYADDQKQYQKLLDEKTKATQEHTSNLQKINDQGAQQTQQKWNQAFKSIDSTLNSSVMGMIRGTQTFQQSVLKVGDSILNSSINWILEGAEKWIAGEAQKIAASQAASAVLQALGLEDATTSAVTQTSMATQEIASNAAVAAAGAYAATAAIPYVGPLLAPAAAAEAYTSVIAFEGLASAAGGYYQVPDDMLANIHKDEMVLPSWAASGMRNMLSGAPASGGGASASAAAGHTFNINTSLSGNSDAGFKALITQNAEHVTATVKKQLRNFQR